VLSRGRWCFAGIGKTALLEHLVASASGLTVERAVGVESEMELAFAGLHQLCVPKGKLLVRMTRALFGAGGDELEGQVRHVVVERR
jgi:hypothetical protein